MADKQKWLMRDGDGKFFIQMTPEKRHELSEIDAAVVCKAQLGRAEGSKNLHTAREFFKAYESYALEDLEHEIRKIDSFARGDYTKTFGRLLRCKRKAIVLAIAKRIAGVTDSNLSRLKSKGQIVVRIMAMQSKCPKCGAVKPNRAHWFYDKANNKLYCRSCRKLETLNAKS